MMNTVKVNFNEVIGKVKPMHAVNNGPTKEVTPTTTQARSNFLAYKEAGIPYARNHDAAFCATYGGEHTVKCSASFPTAWYC